MGSWDQNEGQGCTRITCQELELIKQRMAFMEDTYRENNLGLHEQLKELNAAVVAVDKQIRNGFSEKVTSLCATVKIHGVLILAGVMGMMAMAAGVISILWNVWEKLPQPGP